MHTRLVFCPIGLVLAGAREEAAKNGEKLNNHQQSARMPGLNGLQALARHELSLGLHAIKVGASSLTGGFGAKGLS